MKKKRTRRKRARRREKTTILVISAAAVALVVLLVVVIVTVQNSRSTEETVAEVATEAGKYIADRPELDVQLLPINEYSRPGLALGQVKGIVVHYTANPGTTAQQNRDYFAGLAETKTTKASSHFIIGLGGEIIQCIPCKEMAYASNSRNSDTIAIECCIADDSGKFNHKTYQSLVHLVTWLMGRYGLNTGDVIRHYDVTGKLCPKYFVEHPSAWDTFKEDLSDYIDKYGVEPGSVDDTEETE